MLDSSILSIVDYNVFRIRNGGLSKGGVSESVTKAHVEYLSHKEYGQVEGAIGYGTRSHDRELGELESMKTLSLGSFP